MPSKRPTAVSQPSTIKLGFELFFCPTRVNQYVTWGLFRNPFHQHKQECSKPYRRPRSRSSAHGGGEQRPALLGFDASHGGQGRLCLPLIVVSCALCALSGRSRPEHLCRNAYVASEEDVFSVRTRGTKQTVKGSNSRSGNAVTVGKKTAAVSAPRLRGHPHSASPAHFFCSSNANEPHGRVHLSRRRKSRVNPGH